MRNLKPVNNIYKIPILKIEALACSEGSPLIGHQESEVLVEGKTFKEAIENLKKSPRYITNYNKLTIQEKQSANPFRLNQKKIDQANIPLESKVLHCDTRFENNHGDYTCGIPMENGTLNLDALNGEFGICCIHGYDIPEISDCPYHRQQLINSRELKPEIEYTI